MPPTTCSLWARGNGQVEMGRPLCYHGTNPVENGVHSMDRELLQDLQSCYARLETKSAQISQALHGAFPLEAGWYNGHYHRDDTGNWVREPYPIPVIGIPGLCDIEVQLDHISLSTKLRRSAALNYSFTPVAGYPFEAYGVEDYLADFYHPGQAIQDLKENIRGCQEEEIGFFFSLPFDVDGAEILELMQLLRREGFYY